VAFCSDTPVYLPVPSRPWRVEVSINPTFAPKELDPSLGDSRQLGAVVSFGFNQLGS
jgi:hypothetical protein